MVIIFDKGIAKKPKIAKTVRWKNLLSQTFLNILNKNKNTIIVINNCVTNQSGQERSNWCPFKKGVIKKFFKLIGCPQNLPVRCAIRIVTPK